ncbi:MAG: hypothetical protein EBX52_06230 [Proteobacteria bacterium]|nr:hypothetical protein [Pseudomonadota bacterium]
MKSVLVLFLGSLPFLGLSAFAQDVSIDTRVSYQPARQNLQICGSLDTTNSAIRSDQFGELTAKATITTKMTTYVAVYSEEDVPSNGKSPAWDEFYSARSRSERISALKDAVKGIGEATAARVEPYFYGEGVKKPRSWKEFSDRIKTAGAGIEYDTCSGDSSHCIRASSWVPKVLNQYAEDNRENLGYARSTVTVSIEPRTTESSTRAPALDKTFQYVARFDGLSLLPDECEKITLSFDGGSIDADARTGYNRMVVSKRTADAWRGRDGLIVISSQGRKQVGPPKLASVSNQGPTFIVNKSQTWERYSANREFAARCIATATGAVYATEKQKWYDDSTPATRALGSASVNLSSDGAAQSFSVSTGAIDSQKEQYTYSAGIRFNATCPFFNTNQF